MLSFFSKKKTSPDTPPEDVIKGQAGSRADDFVVVDNQQFEGLARSNNPAPMMPMYPHPSYVNPGANQNPVSYLLGIPFNLSPQLNMKSNFEITQMEVDGILALITKQMQIESEYDFKLERGILADCY